MDVVETDEKEHITTFKIVHSEFYQRTQLKFLAAVASYGKDEFFPSASPRSRYSSLLSFKAGTMLRL
jgi:hypothetical protein